MQLCCRTIVLVGLSGSMLIGATDARAQPTTRDHRRQPAPPPPPPVADTGPTEAPPTPREEKIAARAGFVWIPGRWDWRGKWEWVAGHWERERAGKKWRDGRWDRKDNRWVYVGGEWIDATVQPPPPVVAPPAAVPPAPPPAPPPVVGGPREAPPPPRGETITTRPGFVWIAGEWDWRDNKWEWVAGHWERERAGKKWRPRRWEQRDGAWARIDGDWEDATTPPVPPPTTPPMRPRREWKLERPVVASYWPSKGKPGTRVVIRGRNFPNDAQLFFGGSPITAAKIAGDRIVFAIPPAATSGLITLRAGRGRAFAVGEFEVAVAFDPVAEQKRLDDERRRAAAAAWTARMRELAKDRAAREAALQRVRAEREASREQRRAERIAALQAKWDRAFLADQDTQDELTLHAQRMAELLRMAEVAELSANGKLAVRITIATSREKDRHDQRMAALKASFQIK